MHKKLLSIFISIMLLTSITMNFFMFSKNKESIMEISSLNTLIEKTKSDLEQKNIAIKNNEYQISLLNEMIENISFKLEDYGVHYNSENVRELSNISISQLELILKGTGLEGSALYFVEAEKIYNINALFLVGIAALESSWGTSDLAKYRNNLTGFKAYNNSVSENATHFSSFKDSIMGTAKLLSEDYLTEGGIYFEGYSAYSVNLNFCKQNDGTPSLTWSQNISKIAKKSVKEIKEEDN